MAAADRAGTTAPGPASGPGCRTERRPRRPLRRFYLGSAESLEEALTALRCAPAAESIDAVLAKRPDPGEIELILQNGVPVPAGYAENADAGRLFAAELRIEVPFK